MKKTTSRTQAIKEACAHYGHKWPKSLTSGVMYFNGHRITIKEFNKWASYFK